MKTMMKKMCYPLLLALSLLPTLTQANERLVTGADVTAQDGDTLIIKINGKKERIQLIGIDAPEDSENPKLQVDVQRTGLKRQTLLKLGKIATEQLRYLLRTQAPFVLYYNPEQRDRYGRIPGDIVNTRGESIAAQMVNNGYAIIIRRDTPPAIIARLTPLQQKALQQRRGLWGVYPEISRLWAGSHLKQNP